MILYINTTDNEKVKLILKKGDKVLDEIKFSARFKQAEKLLPEIDKLLKKKKIKLKDLKEIRVENYGGSFTSLRIGVITANTLGFALGIPVKSNKNNKTTKKYTKFNIVEPIYNREPNITLPKK